jgi:hypothetical protein
VRTLLRAEAVLILVPRSVLGPGVQPPPPPVAASRMLKNLFGKSKPKDKFSLDNLKYLYGQLIKEPIITNANKGKVVEVLRSIAELMIWGDQHVSGRQRIRTPTAREVH